ncbi:sodium/glutamate symporter [Wohlfahrtiimonas chitiniclastica]|uniref:sodium/glutamate symporter n=1 Tax=Wohlfahrtiimonas chitiniclastica TaxID=400946 RepID=UPI001BCF8F07|nr:sodium/glutamate symporter [Wohlfahrtiimonas chitiniclastica]MBS7818348.1 sodium/glutamate symporter [Wohlfahrtiimonas chitiniclastica]MBS7826318.1 sodium/glutamate symporter [Wohlfahrtiimonas chitiniclastica]
MEAAKTITEIPVDIYNTLLCASLVLLLGSFLTKRLAIFNRLTLPSPVVGGLLAALALFALRSFQGIQINFDQSLKDPLMLMFFASIGLNANIKQLMAGGKMIAIFLIGVVGLLIIQNAVGVGLATALDQNPLLGLLAGSITLSGGHGTGAAWGATFAEKYGFTSATEIAMACATFGLVLGGLIGGPIARFLINRKPDQVEIDPTASADSLTAFDRPTIRRAITASSMLETIAMLAICLSAGTAIAGLLKGTAVELPTFVCVLFVGVIISNLVNFVPSYQIFERAVSIAGNVCLSLFLAMALMSLKLWDLATLAVPMLVILTVQTVVMAMYAIFVTYRLMGSDYTAAVLSAGHCGFGMGATPTAIANMQVVTEKYGPAPVAFIVVPMVGAFFIDLVNVIVIQGFLKLPMFTSMLTAVPTP